MNQYAARLQGSNTKVLDPETCRMIELFFRSLMVKCESCEHDFEKGNIFKYHKENLCAKFLAYFIFNGDLQNWVRCELCDTKFRTESDLDLHKMAVWCNKCQKEWHCEFHNVWTRCIECDKGLGCKAKYNRHWNQKHKLE